MTFPEILKLIRQRWWVLVLCPLLAMAAAFILSTSMTPIYESSATAIIEHQVTGGAQDLAAIQAAERRAQTFNQLVGTRSVLLPVIDTHELDMTLDDFRSKLSVSSGSDSQLLTISIQDPDPELAAELANAVAVRFQEFVRETQQAIVLGDTGALSTNADRLQEQIESARSEISNLESLQQLGEEQEQELDRLQTLLVQLEDAHETLIEIEESLAGLSMNVGSQVFIVESAAPNSAPVSPRTVLNTGLGGILGLLFGVALILGYAYIDDNVKSIDDIRRIIGRPVIGTVPLQPMTGNMEQYHTERTMSGEIFRGIRTSLQFTMVDRSVKSIVVTSMRPEEGKTTIAANLAIVLAQGGLRVILVDADMRRPRLHGMFDKVRNDRGLSNLLLQSPAVIENVVQSTAIKNLKVLASGPLPPNPPDLFGSVRMRSLVDALEESADIVVFDSPPVAISESLLLSSLVDGIVFVVRAGKLRSGELADGIESLKQTGVTILGVVLNGVNRSAQETYRVYQQYYSLDSEETVPQSSSGFGRLGRLFTRN